MSDELDEVDRMANEFTAKIMEMADSVHVFITKHDGGEDSTKSFNHGRGNWYARYGQVSKWVDNHREDEEVEE